MSQLDFQVTTESNLFIGGNPSSFEIGGIDLHTVTDYRGEPFIPASSLKGALRRIVKECLQSDPEAEKLKEAYQKYLADREKEVQDLLENKALKIEPERLEAMQKRFGEVREEVSADAVFGIPGFNDTPKLIFNDLMLAKEGSLENVFSIDTKTSIISTENDIRSNPRTYKTVRPGVTFDGTVLFYKMEKLDVDIEAFVKKALSMFNGGFYRLGNSGSRGYGKINVTFLQESD